MDHPIVLSDATQIDAEYYASGAAKGTMVLLSGDGDGPGAGFDPEFATKCVAFQSQGWNVIAIHSIRWLKTMKAKFAEISAQKKCLNISEELHRYIETLLPHQAQTPSAAQCLPLVGFSYGSTLGTMAYLQKPSLWCGLVTLSWCNEVNLEGVTPQQSICTAEDGKDGFVYKNSDLSINLERYTGPGHSLIVQGTADTVCRYKDTTPYLSTSNRGLKPDLLSRYSVKGSNHGIFLDGHIYPWMGDFLKELDQMQASGAPAPAGSQASAMRERSSRPGGESSERNARAELPPYIMTKGSESREDSGALIEEWVGTAL